MKGFKKAVFKQTVILGVVGGLLLLNACSSTKVLEDRGDIPAPSLTPPGNANELVTQELQTQPVITTPEQPTVIQTATGIPGFHEGVEGKVKYTIQKGDSLWKVSKMFDVSVRELAAYNNMDVNRKLKVGTVLQIPPSGLATPKAITATIPVTTEKHKKHTTTIKRTNGVNNHNENGEKTYTVKKGDSLKSVAKKYGINVKELVAANHRITEKSKLKAGYKLNIPAKSEKVEKAMATTDTVKVETQQAGKSLNDLINNDVIDTTKSIDNNKAQEVASAAAAPNAAPVTSVIAEQKPAAPNYLPHTVKEGDTWQAISDMYGLSVDDLKKANPSVITDEPKVGITVNIPEE